MRGSTEDREKLKSKKNTCEATTTTMFKWLQYKGFQFQVGNGKLFIRLEGVVASAKHTGNNNCNHRK